MATRERRKIDELTEDMNAWLAHLVISCSRPEGIKDFFDLAVLGYSTDEQGNPIVGPALIGPLAGRDVVTISEVADCPARFDTVTVSAPDEDTGEMLDLPQSTPIWIDPVARGLSPTCSALVKTCTLLDAWIADHPDSFPPIVINITDGRSSDGDPVPYADAVKQRATHDGTVLFFNCWLSSMTAAPFLFKGNEETLPEGLARTLYAMSSVLPDNWRDTLRNSCSCDTLEPNARGLSCNTSMRGEIIRALFRFRGPSIRR